MDLLSVTDLSRVWIEADLYEYEAQSCGWGRGPSRNGGRPEKSSRRGLLHLPDVSPETRTLKVRFEFPTPGFA